MISKQKKFDYDSLISCAKGELFGLGNPQLPMPPMLMMDRVTEISDEGGENEKGHVVAEFDVKPNLWFFDCHFEGDPVMPGCLGLDALWQLTGFNLGWRGMTGRGRALGVGEIKFVEEIKPDKQLIQYKVSFKKIFKQKRFFYWLW
jgi:3-hydroxyacyl-[acyl-carrier protein] dehydratase/trans-2-decenoyl-[acyl-carrier protein] isomerase